MTASLLNSSATTARLSVNLSALKANYQSLQKISGSARCAGVVKADAYGLGMEPVSRALWDVGCRTYFVAMLGEAEALRNFLPEAEIYILNGLMKGAAANYARLNSRPVLASIEEIDEWSHYCRDNNTALPAAIHVDTGINRLGLEYDQALQCFQSDKTYQNFELTMVMSHLACADEPDHPLNGEQVRKFEALRELFEPTITFSLANSAGILSVQDAHFDLVRPGIALYGSNPVAGSQIKLETVAGLEARILQVRSVPAGQSVGYGATYVCQKPSKIAILGLGYADGYLRKLSSNKASPTTYVSISGHLAPVIGRVSMDMIGVDVTDLPQNTVKRGMMAEVIGENISLDGVALAAETISYEVLTRLGNRFDREYT